MNVFVESLGIHVQLFKIWQRAIFLKIHSKVVPFDKLLMSKDTAQVLPFGHREGIDAFVEQAVRRVKPVG